MAPEDRRMTVPCPGHRAAALALLLATFPAFARERSEVPDRYKWNLSDLYPSERAWVQARADLEKRVRRLSEHRGHLGDSAEGLWRGLDAMFTLDRELSRLTVYARSLSDEDTRAARPRQLLQSAEQLAVDFGAASAFVKPEILSLDPAKVRAFQAKDRRLEPYRFFLDDTLP